MILRKKSRIEPSTYEIQILEVTLEKGCLKLKCESKHFDQVILYIPEVEEIRTKLCV